MSKAKHSKRATINKLFYGKTDKLSTQLIRYLFVGGLASIVDVGSLYIITSKLHVYYLISVAIAFILGIIVNYLLSVAWVFNSTGRVKLEFVVFLVIGLGGLGISEAVIWFGVSKFHVGYLAAKLVALVIVMMWNFALRKLMFDKLNKYTGKRGTPGYGSENLKVAEPL